MTRTRFYSPASSFSRDGTSVELGPEEARHLREVLRLRAGDAVFVFDGAGREFQSIVVEARRNSAQLNVIVEIEPTKPESPLDLTLAVALLKGEKFDLVVQKTTELGVTKVIPMITTRADIRIRDAADAGKRLVRWQRIAVEAAKQSGRARVPEILSPHAFSSLVTSTPKSKMLMFSERGGTSLAEALKNCGANPVAITAFVGSEGGWTDEEIEAARGAGSEIVTLGGRILRAETAAIVVTALLQNHCGDLV